MRVVAAGCLSALLVLPLACDADPGPEPVTPRWHETTLPEPSGPPGRIAVRDAVRCGEEWTAVGGVFLSAPTETRDTRPAAWRSDDGVEWTALDVTATTFWGRRAILSTVACAGGRVVAIGARSGGAHAYPRVTSFHEKDGGLDDQRAVFTLYGGATATNVGPITGADPGWLITGNRISGPAAWHSDDGRDFVIEEGVPGLADEEGFTSLAQAATWDGDGWVMVGGGSPSTGGDREPLVWESPDATSWQRHEVPGTSGFDDLQRVLAVGDDLVALGLRGDGFGVWRREGGDWSMGEGFGVRPDSARASPFVSSLTGSDRGLWSTTSDGASYALWHSTDGERWSAVDLPVEAPDTAGGHILTVAAAGESVLLLADDGTDGRVWWSTE